MYSSLYIASYTRSPGFSRFAEEHRGKWWVAEFRNHAAVGNGTRSSSSEVVRGYVPFPVWREVLPFTKLERDCAYRNPAERWAQMRDDYADLWENTSPSPQLRFGIEIEGNAIPEQSQEDLAHEQGRKGPGLPINA